MVNNSTFVLNPEGDNLFLYCLDGLGDPHFIFGFNFAGTWSASGMEDYGVSETALPESLAEVGSVLVDSFPNWKFDNTGADQDPEVLRQSFSNEANWIGSDLRYEITPPNDPSSVGLVGASITASLLACFAAVFFENVAI